MAFFHERQKTGRFNSWEGGVFSKLVIERRQAPRPGGTPGRPRIHLFLSTLFFMATLNFLNFHIDTKHTAAILYFVVHLHFAYETLSCDESRAYQSLPD